MRAWHWTGWLGPGSGLKEVKEGWGELFSQHPISITLFPRNRCRVSVLLLLLLLSSLSLSLSLEEGSIAFSLSLHQFALLFLCTPPRSPPLPSKASGLCH